MSLILDALSRAEREKREEANSAPGILAQELASPAVERGRRGTTAAMLAVAISIALLAAVLFYALGQDGAASMPSGTVHSPVKLPGEQAQRQVVANKSPAAFDKEVMPWQGEQRPDSSVVSAGDSVIRPEAESSIGIQQSTDAVAALYAMPEEASVADRPLGGESAPGETEAATAPQPAGESLAEELVDIEQVLREMRAKANGDTLQPHPAPLLKDLSKQFRDRVPTLLYSGHDFNSAGRSSVVINGDILRPTQRSRGVEVREILADSVILRFEGTDFRMESLNSWVNL